MAKGKIFHLLRKLLPDVVKRHYTTYRAKKFKRLMYGKSSREVFSEIYRRGIWGHSRDGSRFYSGSGSHESKIVDGYVDAVETFISSLSQAPNVVDLGCGDFTVGRKLRHLCDRYIACDIVKELIDYNKSKYVDLAVDFSCIDIAQDDLPPGDVVFIRQVFQHLSNAEISSTVLKIRETYSYIVLTEHLPLQKNFTPNKDKPSGADIRTSIGSGIVLTDDPFNLDYIERFVIFQTQEEHSLIRTTVYRIK